MFSDIELMVILDVFLKLFNEIVSLNNIRRNIFVFRYIKFGFDLIKKVVD